MEKDWRLVNQEKYLFRKKLLLSEFHPSERNDHVHCSFCWGKFGQENGMIQSGYCTDDQRWWICKDCFSDFVGRFEWEVINGLE